MVSEVAHALMVNLCLGFSSSMQANDQVSHIWIPLTSEVYAVFRLIFAVKVFLTHQVSGTLRKEVLGGKS